MNVMNRYKSKITQLSLENNVQVITKTYLHVAEIAEEIVEEYYGRRNKELHFPIDIDMIANEMGLKVEYRKLNEGSNQFSRVLGKIEVNSQKSMITVDNVVSYKTQRYAVAHAIGRFLLKEGNILDSSYAIPLIPQDMEELKADVIALFLLLPKEVFKNEFVAYLKKIEDCPLNVDEWLEYLSDKSQVTLFNLAIGYQQLKQVLCLERQEQFQNNGGDIMELLEDPNNIIFT